MNFYTDVFTYRNKIYVRGYNENGRFNNIINYKPYLFIPSKKESQYKTIDNKNVDKVEFDSINDAREFMKKYHDVQGMPIYGLNSFVHTFIYDTFKDMKYSNDKIKVVYIDIEVEHSNGFPDIQIAGNEITAISMIVNNLVLCFGCKDYESKEENVKYLKCKNEIDLLNKFLTHWERIDPDVVSGWNIEFFDIPYIINRIRRVLGEDAAKRLSYWKILKEKNVSFKGRDNQSFIPLGVSILDYLHLYQKFTQNDQESYKLDHIAFVELEEKKIDYSEYESLNQLYELDYEKFIDYNIHDSNLVKRINEKNKFIELVFAIAYDAKVTFSDALTSVKLWDIIIHNYLMDKNIVIPNEDRGSKEMFSGAFVKEPQIGKHEWVVSFDLTSLYPMLIQMYNISPETFVGYLPTNKHIEIDAIIDGGLSKYHDYLKEKNVTCAANLCTYSKEKVGFLSDLMAIQFRLRDEYKKKMISAKKRKEELGESTEIENKIAMYHNLQWAKKIQLNSAYGAIGNPYFRYYDKKHAEAITLSGQLSTKWIEKKLNQYFNKLLETKTKDYIIASDTDSVYVNMADLVNKFFKEKDVDKITKFLDKISETRIQPFIDASYKELFDMVNGMKNTMKMKREAICDVGIWKAKKMYILNVLNNEGVQYKKPELKYVGLEVVRSSTPSYCKDAIKEAINIIVNKSESNLQSYIKEFKEKFKTANYQEIAFPRSVSDIDKWQQGKSWKTGCPVHVKGCIVYNNMIKDLKLQEKYPIIYNSEKIKWLYLKEQNPTPDKVISFNNILPKEFNIEKYIDYDLMFEKTFLQPVIAITNVIGWEYEKQDNLSAWM